MSGIFISCYWMRFIGYREAGHSKVLQRCRRRRSHDACRERRCRRVEVRDVVLDLTFVTSSVRSHEPGFAGLSMELEVVLLHQSLDAEHRWAVLEHQEQSIHAEVGEVDLELALWLDDAVRRSQAHVGARPHAIEKVARQRVLGAEMVS